jgi:iron complex outermembrane recepter protein
MIDRRTHCSRATLLMTLATIAAAGSAAAQSSMWFDLPEQSLEASLRSLGKATNINILIDRKLVAGLKARALRADLSVDQAIERLLEGTGLRHEFINEHTVVLTVITGPRSDDTGRDTRAAETRSGAALPPAQPRIRPADAAGTASDDNLPRSVITVTASKMRSLDQVTATGSRLGLAQREVPATVDSVDADQIIGRGSHSVRTAIETVAGVTVGGSPGDPVSLSMRGFTGSQIMVLFDGINIGPSVIVNRPGNSFGLDRVEVLKGPGSVLYGQGAIGGVVNTVSKVPQFDAQRTDVIATFGSFGRTNLGLGTTLVPADTVALRADLSRTSSDGFIEGASEVAMDAGAALRWRPNRSTDVRFELDYLNDDPSPYFGTPLVSSSFATDSLSAIKSSDGFAIDRRTRRLNYNVSDYRLEAEQWWAKVFLTWSPTDNLTVNAHAHYFDAQRTWMNAEHYAFDPSSGRVARDRFLVTHDQALHGMQVSLTNISEILGRKHTLLFGGEYADFDFRRTRGTRPGDDVDLLAPAAGFFGPVEAQSMPSYWSTRSVFGESSLALTPRLRLVTGIRHDQTDLDRPTFRVDGSLDPEASFTRTYISTAGRAGLVFDITPDISTHLSYGVGSDPPTPLSLISLSPPEQSFDLSTSYQVEVGLKGTLPDRSADFTLALYHIERRDILSRIDANTIANIGRQSSRGFEATANLKLTRHWTLSTNAAYTYSKFDEFTDSLAGNVSGKLVPNVPRWVGNVWTSARDVAGLPLEIGAGVRFVGDRYGNYANSLELDGFTLVTAYAAWSISDLVLVSGRVKNLLDEDYANWADIFYPDQVLLGEPRTFEIELVARF